VLRDHPQQLKRKVGQGCWVPRSDHPGRERYLTLSPQEEEKLVMILTEAKEVKVITGTECWRKKRAEKRGNYYHYKKLVNHG
jgi:hypothetical protein